MEPMTRRGFLASVALVAALFLPMAASASSITATYANGNVRLQGVVDGDTSPYPVAFSCPDALFDPNFGSCESWSSFGGEMAYGEGGAFDATFPTSLEGVYHFRVCGIYFISCTLGSEGVTLGGSPPAPVCGNNTVESGEQCDDGNTANGDGCSSTCQTEAAPVCGDAACNGTETVESCPADCAAVPFISSAQAEKMMDDTNATVRVIVVGGLALCLFTLALALGLIESVIASLVKAVTKFKL